MPSTIVIVVNDEMPDQYFQLTNKYDNTALDISASTTTVTAKFRSRGNTDESEFEANLTKVIGGLGVVMMAWPAALDYTAGRYELEVTVLWDSQPQTVLDIARYRLKSEFPDAA
jgi:hypothetical protein